jgi:hypothetical protein
MGKAREGSTNGGFIVVLGWLAKGVEELALVTYHQREMAMMSPQKKI